MKQSGQAYVRKKKNSIVTIMHAKKRQNLESALAVHMGRKLKERRVFENISQTRLGKELGVSFQQIQKYERGMNYMNSDKLLDAAKFLNVSINYFFGGFAEYEKHQGSAKQVRTEETFLNISNHSEQLYHLVGILSRIQNPAVMAALVRLAKSLSAEEAKS